MDKMLKGICGVHSITKRRFFYAPSLMAKYFEHILVSFIKGLGSMPYFSQYNVILKSFN